MHGASLPLPWWRELRVRGEPLGQPAMPRMWSLDTKRINEHFKEESRYSRRQGWRAWRSFAQPARETAALSGRPPRANLGFGFGVWGLGFRVWGLGFGVSGFGF